MSNTNPSKQALWQRLTLIQKKEARVLLWSALYFFFLLLSYYFLRPVREAMGIAKGADKLPWLMSATMVIVLLANPLYAMLVSHMQRRRFIPLISHFFAANLLIFFALFKFLPEEYRSNLGYAFYVWLSVFNLFVVSIFWSLMSDIFTEDQGKRLFGIISMGGSLGAILGAACTDALSRGSLGFHVEPASLMLFAFVGLECSVFCMLRLAPHFNQDQSNKTFPAGEPNSDFKAGLRAIMASRYLQTICVYILLFSITSTFLYLTQADIVAHSFSDSKERTAAFARIDLWGNIVTLFLQLFLTSRLLNYLGVSGVLLLLPLITLVGFGALALWPSFAVLAVIQVVRRGFHYAVDRPAREILYIPLGPEEKYKSKPFIDTFVYRSGDLLGVWAPAVLSFFSASVSLAALSSAAVWLGAGRYLGGFIQGSETSTSTVAAAKAASEENVTSNTSNSNDVLLKS
jgi:AAA family ATP:ADP antiporter